MRILFFTIGNAEVASSRTRAYQYLPYLRQRGIECRVIFHILPWQFKRVINMQKENLFIKLCSKIYSSFKVVIFLTLAPRYDILFIQRVLLPLKIQRLILWLNKNIVFDFDDAIYLCDKGEKFIPRLEYMLKSSKYVVLENDCTKEYTQRFNKNILLITGPIDIQRYTPKENDSNRREVVLGWIGSPTTSVYLELLYKVFEIIAGRYRNLVIELIGLSMPPKLKGVNIVVKKWTLYTEVPDLQDFDIGLMPLYNDKWSEGKGGYKLLQYMAMGIPSVASPVGINNQLIKEGVNGFLACGQEEWVEKLSRLIEDPELRNKMGRNGRKIAEELYSCEVSAPRLIRELRSIYNVR